mmetsp:Transcript_4076/g.11663  ORF Transcript_4076/g.11663 Transcript_4076/m.11663 type:complete len:232 (+) Transcript_4076:406-1101(+)
MQRRFTLRPVLPWLRPPSPQGPDSFQAGSFGRPGTSAGAALRVAPGPTYSSGLLPPELPRMLGGAAGMPTPVSAESTYPRAGMQRGATNSDGDLVDKENFDGAGAGGGGGGHGRRRWPAAAHSPEVADWMLDRMVGKGPGGGGGTVTSGMACELSSPQAQTGVYPGGGAPVTGGGRYLPALHFFGTRSGDAVMHDQGRDAATGWDSSEATPTGDPLHRRDSGMAWDGGPGM